MTIFSKNKGVSVYTRCTRKTAVEMSNIYSYIYFQCQVSPQNNMAKQHLNFEGLKSLCTERLNIDLQNAAAPILIHSSFSGETGLMKEYAITTRR